MSIKGVSGCFSCIAGLAVLAVVGLCVSVPPFLAELELEVGSAAYEASAAAVGWLIFAGLVVTFLLLVARLVFPSRGNPEGSGQPGFYGPKDGGWKVVDE